MSDTRRLFFALWPTFELRQQLAALTTMAAVQMACRPMAACNLHVTLAFIGSVPNARLPELVELGHASAFAGCEIVFDRLAVWQPAHVLVLKSSAVSTTLSQLVGHLQMQLARAGFHIEDRPYQPHVTLAREVRASGNDASTQPLIWTAQDFVLVESVSTAGGVQYQVLATFAG